MVQIQVWVQLGKQSEDFAWIYMVNLQDSCEREVSWYKGFLRKVGNYTFSKGWPRQSTSIYTDTRDLRAYGAECNFHQRALAGAIPSEQGCDLSLLTFHVNAGEQTPVIVTVLNAIEFKGHAIIF